jgi:hypothetical protein
VFYRWLSRTNGGKHARRILAFLQQGQHVGLAWRPVGRRITRADGEH